MPYQVVFRPAHVHHAVTLWLMELADVIAEDSSVDISPAVMLMIHAHLAQITTAAHQACLSYFGRDPFSRKELLSQVNLIAADGTWINVAEAIQTDLLYNSAHASLLGPTPKNS